MLKFFWEKMKLIFVFLLIMWMFVGRVIVMLMFIVELLMVVIIGFVYFDMVRVIRLLLL